MRTDPTKQYVDSFMLNHEDVQTTVKLTAKAFNNITLSPTHCTEQNYVGKRLIQAWPQSTWDSAMVSVNGVEPISGNTYTAWNKIELTTSTTQNYSIVVRFYYK